VSTGDLGATGHDPLESHAQEVGRAAGSDARRGIDDGSGAAATSSSTETANAASAPGPSDAFDSIAASTRIPAAMNGRAPEREPDSALHRRRTGADRDIGAEQLLAAPSAETCAGGLLFLVPVLDRLGYAAWLEAQPQWARLDVARRVFELVLARLGVDGSDAAWQLVGNAADPTWQPGRLADASMKPYALARQPDGRIAPRRRFESRQKRSVRVPRRFVAPAGWRTELRTQGESLQLVEHPAIATLWDPSGRLLLGAWRGPCPRELLSARRRANSSGPARENSRRHRLASAELEPERHDFARLVTSAWLVAARRWLRRHAGIGIATLVRRRALLVLTPTHLDLASELASADMRIRRAGLDIDPGWVPWLGRVVSFHYRETEPGIPT
jgi:hypothetical protein